MHNSHAASWSCSMSKMFFISLGVRVRMSLGIKRLSDRAQEFFRIVRLLKKRGGAELFGRFSQALELAGGDENERGAGQSHFVKALGDRKARPDGHPNVHQQEVWAVVECSGQAAKAIRCDER